MTGFFRGSVGRIPDRASIAAGQRLRGEPTTAQRYVLSVVHAVIGVGGRRVTLLAGANDFGFGRDRLR